jgi:hypothetical protein
MRTSQGRSKYAESVEAAAFARAAQAHHYELSAGKSLGMRAGWPPDVIDKLTEQINPSDPDGQWSCDSVARGNEFMSGWDRLGERGLAREAIERSGETVAELSRSSRHAAGKPSRAVVTRALPGSPAPGTSYRPA